MPLWRRKDKESSFKDIIFLLQQAILDDYIIPFICAIKIFIFCQKIIIRLDSALVNFRLGIYLTSLSLYL